MRPLRLAARSAEGARALPAIDSDTAIPYAQTRYSAPPCETHWRVLCSWCHKAFHLFHQRLRVRWHTRGHWFDCDGVVTIDDLALLLGHWGACLDPCCLLDLTPINGDGLVDAADLAVMLHNFGEEVER